MRKKQLSSTIDGTLMDIIEKSPNKSARLEDLIRKGLLYEEQQGNTDKSPIQLEVLKHLEAIKKLLGVEHTCTCGGKCNEAKKPIAVDTEVTLPINIELPDSYETENFKGILLKSTKVMNNNYEETDLRIGKGLEYIVEVNGQHILVYNENGCIVAYEVDTFNYDNGYRGKEVKISMCNVYQFLQEWGIIK